MAKAPDTILRLVENFEQNLDIDKLVYELYNLTPEEVKIVEDKE